MSVDLSWWSYPYILFKNNSFPIAFGVLCLQCVTIMLCVGINNIVHIKNKDYRCIKINWRHKIILNSAMYSMFAFLMFAFAQTNQKYILYQAILGCVRNIRQIDVFAYTILLFMFLWGNKFKNCYTYYNKLMKYLICLNFTELIIILFLQFDEGEKGWLSVSVKGVLVCGIILINCVLKDIEFVNCNKNEELNGTLQISEGEEVFETRQAQLEEIYKKIAMHNSEEQMTLFISDEWGGGKTYFSKHLLNKLKQSKKFNVVWINMTDFNEKETFIKQVLKKIQLSLNEGNYYTGSSSEIEKYLEAVLDITLNKTIAELLHENLGLGKETDLQKGKSLTEMSQSFSDMLGEDRIVIMIDDMDRCSEETIASTVKLFSEIIFLPKSVVIFAGDYKNLLSKKGFKNGFFDKYFMYNYNLNPVPYGLLFDYYQRKYVQNELGLPCELNLAEQINRMIGEIKTWKEGEEHHGIAEMPELKQGDLRNEAIEQSMALVNNLENGIKGLEKNLSNPRRCKRIFDEVYDRLRSVSYAVKKMDMNIDSGIKKELTEVIFPGILFYSLARTVCTERFWDICVEDFTSFKEDVLNLLSEINEIDSAKSEEEFIYMLLVYYFFSSRFNSDKHRIDKISDYYKTLDLEEFLKNSI